MSDEQPRPTLTMGKTGRKTKAQLDARENELANRERLLLEREAKLDAKGIDPNPAPIQSATAGAPTNTAPNPQAIAKEIEVGRKFPDVQPYLDKYPDKKLMWINDLNGDVQRWIDANAEPVPRLINEARKFEGLTDKVESKWTRVVGGDDGMGGHYWVYLLMMDPQRYDQVALAPLRARQQAIQDSLIRGSDQSDGAGGELNSYAPNLPSGGRGFEQIRDHLTGRG